MGLSGPVSFAATVAQISMENSQSERARIIKRKTRPHERITTKTVRGQFYVCEVVRRMVARGDALIASDMPLEICRFGPADNWAEYRLQAQTRWDDNHERLTEYFELQQEQRESELQSSLDQMEFNLKELTEVYSWKQDDGSWTGG